MKQKNINGSYTEIHKELAQRFCYLPNDSDIYCKNRHLLQEEDWLERNAPANEIS